jgi:DNA mismatch repair protein MutS
MSIYEQYISYHKKYQKIYGIKSLVLMQVGSFYEMYGTDTEGPQLKDIADLLNTVCTKKDKNVKEVSMSNPYLVGFPMVAVDKFVSLLIKNGYTLIMVDQVTAPPEPKRQVTNIYSPSTYIGTINTVENNYASCIYLEYEKQKSNQNLLCVGLSSIDISTGKVVVDEGISSYSDGEIAIDNALRFLSVCMPKEVFLVLNGTGKFNEKDLINILQLDERIVKIKKFDEKYSKIKFQSEFLSNIYSSKLNMSIIENLDLEKTNYARISLVMLIDYVRNYSEKLVSGLAEPEINVDTSHMILGNNATYQLSILENDSYNYLSGTKFKSLYDVVNNAQTAMGKRFIREIITAPYISDKKIKDNLELTEYIIEKNLYNKYKEQLKQIIDIEKLKRKMNMQILQPYELSDFIDSFTNISQLFKSVQIDKINIKFSKDIIEDINKFNKVCEKVFNIDELKKNTLNDFKKNVFNKNIYSDIDNLIKNYESEHDFIHSVKTQFDSVLKGLQKKKSTESNFVKINSTPSEGYFISMSRIRYENLEKYYSKSDDDIVLGEEKIKFKDLEIKDLKSIIKVFIKNNAGGDISDIEEKLLKLVYTKYIEQLQILYRDYNDMFIKTLEFIIKLDFVVSNAITAKLYNYVKPKLVKNDTNIINAKQIRHPIVERIIDYAYVPHDITLNDKLNGMLIYGLNSSGKSVMMKAVGLSLIMAQCGMYVPCTEFEFTIYNSVYTRITGNDNIFRGQSSFTLEMTELNSIIKRADKKTLVIGDEICRGTENISGNAIVASTIIHLAKVKASFIFATHLHELVQISKIRELTNVKAYHLSVDYDSKKDLLIYDRTLKEGSGDKIYGIVVAKYIIDNKQFMEDTVAIKNELTQDFSSMISGKKSRYNNDIYVYKCELCGKTDKDAEVSFLQTHHINYQKDCKDGFSIDKPHIQMNSKANLAVICETCHNNIHKEDIKLEKKVTSKGKKIMKL